MLSAGFSQLFSCWLCHISYYIRLTVGLFAVQSRESRHVCLLCFRTLVTSMIMNLQLTQTHTCWQTTTSCHPVSYLAVKLLLVLPFNGLFSRTTWVSWYQKGKPVWIWMRQDMMGFSDALASAVPYTNSLHLAPNQQCQSTEDIAHCLLSREINDNYKLLILKIIFMIHIFSTFLHSVSILWLLL